ncbi:MAG TPA: MBL fold metallo-hydrolase [Syntrophomonadaceae bacterium]|nr:MBL fold metallo-hydrolase [Syntrophomonadaceae bacterium]
MKIKWLGHACFYIETGYTKVVTDPFDKKVGYPMTAPEANLVTVSHQHWDHCAVDTVGGSPDIIKEAGIYQYHDITVKGIPSFHDPNSGNDRGPNIIFSLQTEGINLVHLGDLGHIPDQAQVKAIGSVDILLIPVGGKFTIDAREAFTTVEMLNPRIVIPMHYKTPHLTFELAPVEVFTSQFNLVVKKPFLELEGQDLKSGTKVIVLDYMS